jgi:hypothetical protein
MVSSTAQDEFEVREGIQRKTAMMDLRASRKVIAANSAQPTLAQNELDFYPVTTPFGRRAILPVGPKITEELIVTSLGHAFVESPPDPPRPKQYIVQDFLADQSQSTGGGAKMQDLIQFDLSAAYGYRYSLTAPSGMQFQVKVPPGAQQLGFSAYLGRDWLNATGGGFFDASTPMTQFANISGPSPILT